MNGKLISGEETGSELTSRCDSAIFLTAAAKDGVN